MPPFPPLPSSLQALRPAQAKFCLALHRFLTAELALDLRSTPVLAAFSGGADSTALLLALRYLAPKGGFRLSAAHLDHALRPSSREEAEGCAAFCRHLGVDCRARRRDIAALSRERGLGIEECAREERYAFLAESARDLSNDKDRVWIATGHTLNDLAEDQLMRLVRGTGWPALGGMTALDPRRRLLRPLLLTSRAAIEDFVASFGLTWIEDASNADTAYLRNRVRHAFLPLLLRENPAYLENAAKLWRMARLDADLLDSLAPSADDHGPQRADADAPSPNPPPSSDHSPFLPTSELAALPAALRLRLYKRVLDALGPGQALFPSLLALDKAWSAIAKGQHRRGTARFQFPGGKSALVDASGIRWLTSAGS
jgi:tRNA(Ile)-lysidine synthase